MNSISLRLCAVVAGFAIPALRGELPPPTVAVFAFQAGPQFENTYGGAIATLIQADLRVLAPIRVNGAAPEAAGLTFEDAPDSGTAADLGRRLGAGELVTGRVLQTGEQYIVTAKVIDASTGAAIGTSVDGTTSDPATALAAELSIRIGGAVFHESAAAAHRRWPAATIRGWSQSVANPMLGVFKDDERAAVMAIDGVPAARKGMVRAEDVRTVQPGRHRVSVGYVHGAKAATFEFYCDFQPGVAYLLRANETPDLARLWVTRPGAEHVPLLALAAGGGSPIATGRIDKALSHPDEEILMIDTRMLH